MEAFSFAINATLPIVLTVAIGYLLKMSGLMSADFAKTANKLVFRVFLPVMLFVNVYSIEDITSLNLGYALYSAIAVVVVFAIGIPIVMLVTHRGDRRGSLLQALFRSNNALIGIPLAQSLFGAEGVIAVSILTAFIIPLFNALGVVSLSIFENSGIDAVENGKNAASTPPRAKLDVKKMLISIAKNPLIISIALGFVALGIRAIFVSCDISFRISEVPAVWKAVTYLSGLATPLALIALGGQFEFSVIRELRREIIAGTLGRILIAPAVCLGMACILFRNTFSGAQFAALFAVFCPPVAVSSVPMAQEMGADSELAGQLVVFSTLFSSFTIFAASFILKAVEIF